MKIPNRIQPLVDDGLIDDVVRRLKSGKEADVYTVLCGEEIRCAKVYKEATQRSFKQAVQYQEGRKVRNSRNARAIVRPPPAHGGTQGHDGGTEQLKPAGHGEGLAHTAPLGQRGTQEEDAQKFLTVLGPVEEGHSARPGRRTDLRDDPGRTAGQGEEGLVG